MLTIIILSSCLFFSLMINWKLYTYISDREENKVKSNSENDNSISIGDTVLLDYSFRHKTDNYEFDVTYELTVLDIADKKVKVESIDFTTLNIKVINDTSLRAPILRTFNPAKWVDISNVRLVNNNKQQMRNEKLNKLGI